MKNCLYAYHCIAGYELLSIRHGTTQHVIARTQNETRWVARVLAGTFLSHMAGRSLPFHSPVRFLFVSFPSHGKSADLCSSELDSDPDSPHLDQFPLDQQRSLLGLYHSLHNHLRHPDDRRTTWKEGRRVDLDLALGFFTGARQQLAVDVFLRGDSEV